MHLDYLLSTFVRHATRPAIVWKEHEYSYAWLYQAVARWTEFLEARGVARGSVVTMEADFSPNGISLLLALVNRFCTVVPLTTLPELKKKEFREIAQAQTVIALADNDHVEVSNTGVVPSHELLLELRLNERPGLVLFSSGSTGKSKAAVHDIVPLLEKFREPRKALRTITFLQFDHIGGINTLLYTLSNGGTVITVPQRSPEAVCATIEKHKAQLLPVSPTFINLLLVSEAYNKYDLSSLETITYGTEVMQESTLARLNTLFPHIRIQQTYGLSEIGIMRSKSRANNSLWVKLGGEGYATRVVDGLLEIKAHSAMLGYLNAPSPFTNDGWFITGDAVEVDGEYFRILGRKSELINVGGEKVYPAEVESVLQIMDGVEDVAVKGESNPITGQIVAAKIKLNTAETGAQFRKRMFMFCQGRLAKYKIPQKIELMTENLHGERFKKMRN